MTTNETTKNLLAFIGTSAAFFFIGVTTTIFFFKNVAESTPLLTEQQKCEEAGGSLHANFRSKDDLFIGLACIRPSKVLWTWEMK